MISAIVLAAGSSKRFGDDKRKALLPSGKMIVEQSVETALACFDEVTLVLRHGDDAFAEQLSDLINNPRLNIFQAPDSSQGMGHSLANVAAHLSEMEGVFILLADMPHIRPATLKALLEVFATQSSNDSIVVPTYNGEFGHPVGFARCYISELAALTGDRGAKPVLNANTEKVVEVAVDDPGVLADVDTPSDL